MQNTIPLKLNQLGLFPFYFLFISFLLYGFHEQLPIIYFIE